MPRDRCSIRTVCYPLTRTNRSLGRAPTMARAVTCRRSSPQRAIRRRPSERFNIMQRIVRSHRPGVAKSSQIVAQTGPVICDHDHSPSPCGLSTCEAYSSASSVTFGQWRQPVTRSDDRHLICSGNVNPAPGRTGRFVRNKGTGI